MAMGAPLDSIDVREQALLSPYAMHSAQSAGREHAEPEHPYRGPFQRDRDRIVHSAAYRRLSAKTQGFTGELGDWLGRSLSPTLFYEFPTVEALARHLVADSTSATLEEELASAVRAVTGPWKRES